MPREILRIASDGRIQGSCPHDVRDRGRFPCWRDPECRLRTLPCSPNCVLFGRRPRYHRRRVARDSIEGFLLVFSVLKRQLDDRTRRSRRSPRHNGRTARAARGRLRQAQVPVVPRGAGTGNYGQCIRFGGIVLDLARLDEIIEITANRRGALRTRRPPRHHRDRGAQSRLGTALHALDVDEELDGWFLLRRLRRNRLDHLEGINAPGNVKSVTLMSCEETRGSCGLRRPTARLPYITYGTTGIMVES